MTWDVRHGDCRELMAEMEPESVDAVVCDPPYGLEFMGKEWDKLFLTYDRGSGRPDAPMIQQREQGKWQPGSSFGGRAKQPRCMRCGKLMGRGTGVCKCPDPVPNTRQDESGYQMQFWHESWAREAFRVLKPGGHMLAMGGDRTVHRMTCAIEDAGFEIRGQIAWIHAQGFPKSRSLRDIGRPELGSALKPAMELVVVARKPLIGTLAANVLAHGTGALNIDACRIETDDDTARTCNGVGKSSSYDLAESGERRVNGGSDLGRWPANVALDEAAAEMLDEMSGERKAGKATGYDWTPSNSDNPAHVINNIKSGVHYGDTGGASRFFYVAKASRREDEYEREPTDTGRDAQGQNAPPGGNRHVPEEWSVEGRSRPNGEGDVRLSDHVGADRQPEIELTGPRFLYTAKASRRERNAGLAGMPEIARNGTDYRRHVNTSKQSDDGIRGDVPRANHHPTVKPIALMRWLVRLVTPPGGTVLDPFAGSGSTGCAAVLEGFAFVGLEQDAEYCEIARKRIVFWEGKRPVEIQYALPLEGAAD